MGPTGCVRCVSLSVPTAINYICVTLYTGFETSMRQIAITLAFLLAGVCDGRQNKIKHVVVLMEENRSFDHMFG